MSMELSQTNSSLGHQGLFHWFQVNGRTFLLDRESGGYFRLDPELFDRLQGLAPNGTATAGQLLDWGIPEEELSLGEEHRKRLVDLSTDQVVAQSGNSALRCLNMVVSQHCNLNCAYCYSSDSREDYRRDPDGGLMTEQDARAVVDFYLRYNLNKGSRNLAICFAGGGEPLTNFPVLCSVVSHCRHLESVHDVRFNFKLSTNGLLLTDDILDYLAGQGVKVKISVDGPADVTGETRFKAGRGRQFDRLLERIRIARQVLPAEQLYAAVTFTRLHRDYSGIIRFVEDLGFTNIKFQFAVHRDLYPRAEEMAQVREQLQSLLDQCIDRWLSTAGEPLVNYETFTYLIRMVVGRYQSMLPCIGGIHDLAVDTSGVVHFCTRTMGMPPYRVGGLLEDEVDRWRRRYLREHSLLRREDCRECWAGYLCGGYCNHLNLLFNGDALLPYEPMCKLRKAYLELGVYAVDELLQKAPGTLRHFLQRQTF